MVAGWEAWVKEWESKQHTNGLESPFEVKEKVMSMKDIRVKLVKEELLRSGEGTEVEREDTPSTFIIMGLEIEESQRYLTIDVKALANPTENQSLEFLKRRTALLKRLRAFRKMQRTYMPNLRRFLTQSQRTLWDTETERDAEAGEAIHAAKLRYRYARNALLRLRGHGPWERELQVLKDDDVRALNERALTEEERAHRDNVPDINDLEEGGVVMAGVVAQGESNRTLSWIWYQARSADPTEQELVEALRVEWCKAYARMRRWHEDTVLVEEEMRRTIEYSYWAAKEWLCRGIKRVGLVDEELEEGLLTYSLEQSAREVRTGEMLTKNWAKLREKGRAFLARETAAGTEVVIPVEESDVSDDDGEEGRPDDEDEGDEELLD
ncbi:hypothetical protein B0H11DRAFT_2263562 [Mycena galericulata]|nr:hypothetical protein B0H11DRAFT_2263562 [Mycena galericulata]